MDSVVKYLILFLLFLAGCSQPHSLDIKKTDKNLKRDKADIHLADNSVTVATVNGHNIYASQIKKLLKVDKKLSVNDALTRLIDNELIFENAEKKDYLNSPDIISMKKKQLALAYISKQASLFTAKDIDEASVKKYYETFKTQFVHGTMLKVTHALVSIQKGVRTPELAEQIAKEIYSLVRNVNTRQAFEDIIKPLQDKYGNIKIEHLPPFERDTSVLISAFTDAAFSVNYPKDYVARPIKTKYGWHVIFIDSQIKKINISYKNAEWKIRNKLIENERNKYIHNLIKKIYDKAKPFIYDQRLFSQQ